MVSGQWSVVILRHGVPHEHPLLKLEHINTYYGLVQVHFDLNLEVGQGQIICLLGGNASGKSTTMKIILGLWNWY